MEKDNFIHPCFENYKCGARFHLPVAFRCDTKCNYCKREYSDKIDRPGVSEGILPLSDVEGYIREKAELYPECGIIGIAGPGDPFANADELFGAFEIVNEKFPDYRCCVCTNGFYLPDNKERFLKSSVKYITLTINSVEAPTLAKIYDHLVLNGKCYHGEEMGNIIRKLQKEALDIIIQKENIRMKINIVVIPGINDGEIAGIVEATRDYGVYIYNLIPMLPVKGTRFGDIEQISSESLEAIKDDLRAAFPGIYIKDNCLRCRADACGRIE